MRLLTWFGLLLFIVVLFPTAGNAQKKTFPTFEQYRVAVDSNIRPARPKLITKMARLFRTGIRSQAATGPDFAGHYTIALLGCGSPCRRYAIVDSLTGNVYFPKELDVIWTSPWRDGDPLANQDPFQYRKDSRLLIIVGSGNMNAAHRKGKYFYQWKNNKLRLIAAIKRDY